MSSLYIRNARAVLPEGIQLGTGIWTKDNIIQGVGTPPDDARFDKVIDARGLYLAPGFIDLHTHGGGGYDYMDAGVRDFLGAAEAAARFGCTTLYPTSVAASEEETLAFLNGFLKAAKEQHSGAQMPGVHLEGSYFAPEQAGAQNPAYIVNPDPDQYQRILSAADGCIKRWSAAPELPGALEFGTFCEQNGIVASIAHSDATTRQALASERYGYRHVTHIYSGMSMVKRVDGVRVGGVLEAAYLSDELTVEMICDGMHLPKELLRLIYKIKGSDKIALVTDSMRAAGTTDTTSVLGSRKNGQRVLIHDGVAWMPAGDSFAGSIATCDRLVRTAVHTADIPMRDALAMMTTTPARIMGIDDRKAYLKKGYDADLVLFDEDVNIQLTIVAGRIVYQA